MSYILDALKKSEEERKKGDVPGLQTYTPTTEVSSGKRTWVIGVMVLVGTNIIGLLIWAPWKPAQPLPIPTQVAAPQIKMAPQPEIVKPVARPAVKPVVKPMVESVAKSIARPVLKPVINPVVEVMREPVAKSPSTYRERPVPVPEIKPASREEYRPKSTPSTAYLPQLSELPQSIQAQIPDLTFSSHMYSSQDKFRSITINGKRLKQGRYYNELLYVNEITEKGAIMGFDGTLFEVDVLGQWGN